MLFLDVMVLIITINISGSTWKAMGALHERRSGIVKGWHFVLEGVSFLSILPSLDKTIDTHNDESGTEHDQKEETSP